MTIVCPQAPQQRREGNPSAELGEPADPTDGGGRPDRQAGGDHHRHLVDENDVDGRAAEQ
jgi:hypothetical protein